MKLQIKSTLIAFACLCAGGIFAGSASAYSIEPTEIPNQSYIIGSHLFTRESNTPAGYRGYIDTRTIMLAAKTISGNTYDDMDIYYKNSSGVWLDGLTNTQITAPDSFDVEFKNLDPYIPTPQITANVSIDQHGKERISYGDYDGGSIMAFYDFGTSNSTDYWDGVNEWYAAVKFYIPASEYGGYYAYHISGEECDVVIDNTTYCNGAFAGTPVSGLATLPVGRTYHVLARAEKTVGERAVYSKTATIEVVVPDYHSVIIQSYPHDTLPTANYVKHGDTIANAIGIGATAESDLVEYFYNFLGWYKGQQNVAGTEPCEGYFSKFGYIGFPENSYCPTNEAIDNFDTFINTPLVEDVILVGDWEVKPVSVKVMPTDAVGAVMGTAKVYVGEAELDGYIYTACTNPDTCLFSSDNSSVALSELNGVENITIYFRRSGLAGPALHEAWAPVTIVPYEN